MAITWRRLNPAQGYYPSSEPGKGIVGGLIGGTSVSHVAMNSSLTRDVWTAVEPDIEAPNINRYVTIGNEKIPTLGGARVQALAAALTLEAMAKEYRQAPADGPVQLDRLPARDVDLDRGHHRRLRRLDRDVARPQRGAPADGCAWPLARGPGPRLSLGGAYMNVLVALLTIAVLAARS